MSSGNVFDALVELEAAEEGSKSRTAAAPMTRVIAVQVKRLREEARMSGADVAAELVKLGIKWNRTTVAKLETLRRESVTVQELLALALVFGVPPIWLLVDAHSGNSSPLATNRPDERPDIAADPWTAYLWMAGRWPLEGSSDRWWTHINGPLEAVFSYGASVDQVRRNRRAHQLFAELLDPLDDPEASAERDRQEAERLAEQDRRALRALVANLKVLHLAGMVLPPVPADVRARADELGIDLAGTER